MSFQQQCLPLSRRRKRSQYEKTATQQNENETMELTRSELDEMDASTYLASVSAQASKLPFVFVSANATRKHDDDDDDIKQCTSSNRNGSGNGNDDDNEAMWQGSATSVRYLYSQRLKLIPPPSIRHLPPIVTSSTSSMEEYSHSILDNFSKLRLYLHQCRENGNTNHGLKERKIPVPPSKDSHQWQIFCLGIQEASGKQKHTSTSNYYDVSSCSSSSEGEETDVEMEEEKETQSNPKTTTTTKSFHKRNVPKNGYEPTTSLLCQFDQIIIRRVLHHHIQQCIIHSNNTHNYEYGLSQQGGKWIYALLARLEKPLHRDEASSLTTLLRELCRLRGELKLGDHDDTDTDIATTTTSGGGGENGTNFSAKDQLSILNTLIIIVGIYFEQCRSLDDIMKVEVDE